LRGCVGLLGWAGKVHRTKGEATHGVALDLLLHRHVTARYARGRVRPSSGSFVSFEEEGGVPYPSAEVERLNRTPGGSEVREAPPAALLLVPLSPPSESLQRIQMALSRISSRASSAYDKKAVCWGHYWPPMPSHSPHSHPPQPLFFCASFPTDAPRALAVLANLAGSSASATAPVLGTSSAVSVGGFFRVI